MIDLLRELLAFMRERKKLWLTPVVLALVLVGLLLIVAQGSLIAPFIYALF